MEVGEGSTKWWLSGGDGQVSNFAIDQKISDQHCQSELPIRFRDIKSAQYSIHQIALMGESVDRFLWFNTCIKPNMIVPGPTTRIIFCRKPVGTWFGPNTVAQVLRKLCLYDPRYIAESIYHPRDSTLKLNFYVQWRHCCTCGNGQYTRHKWGKKIKPTKPPLIINFNYPVRHIQV